MNFPHTKNTVDESAILVEFLSAEVLRFKVFEKLMQFKSHFRSGVCKIIMLYIFAEYFYLNETIVKLIR